MLLEDQDKLDQLLYLKIVQIKEIKTLSPDRGRDLLGAAGENGVVQISLKRGFL